MMVEPLQLIFEAAYLHARRVCGITLSEQETNRLGLLSAMLAGEGRRRFLRLSIDRSATLTHLGASRSVRIIDLSVEGCLVECANPPAEGETVRLVLEDESCRRIFTGVVYRHSLDAPQRVALRFSAIPLELRLTTRHPSLFDALDDARAAS